MPNILKILRSHNKRRSNSSSSSPLKKRKSNGIFRTKDDNNNREKKSRAKTTPTIKAAITFSLSEDAESYDTSIFPDGDIESQIDELKGESLIDDVFFQEPVNNDKRNEVTTKFQAPTRCQPSKTTAATVYSDSKDIVKGTTNNDKTITFTHLEIMRNHLNQMMQVANKDKEIHQLKQADEDKKVTYSKLLASKDNEIAKIKKVLEEVESALSQAENKLASADEEHSKTIEVLMETQYEYHELKSRSWISPFFNCFESKAESK